METTATHDIKKHVRLYISVFIALLALTVVTVAISYLHLDITAAVFVALTVAIIKGSLVASYFMHLISEKKIIFVTLILTVLFFAVLMALPLFSHSDQVNSSNVP